MDAITVQIDRLTLAMIEFDKGDAMRIQHFLKVHRFAQLIAKMEHVDNHTQLITEMAAVVHDIGIHAAEAKYGSSNGKYQEELGPEPARELLTRMGFSAPDIERVCYLVGHHHTYSNIDGIDYQILVEADFLVNFYEDGISQNGIDHAMSHVFKTESGKKLCQLIYKELRK
ncbi:HD domain-containing protein [Hallella multisaccharivorax]|nr:HD domain-containing protein [Hallella multisaccharivorax]